VTTIATFNLPAEAHLLRMRLESAGIEAFVQDENLIQTTFFSAAGGIRVQVADEDVPSVRKFLAEDVGI
jgi:hypothetical protein